MNPTPRIAVVLADWEMETFFPGNLFEDLKELASEVHTVEPAQLGDEKAWKAWLAEKNPEILVTAWMTPKLPEDILDEAPALRMVCHLTGSIKNTVPPVLLEKGLKVTNWGNSISRTVAETGLMLTIAGLRRVSYWTLAMHNRGEWKDRTNVHTGSLFGRKVGLHGFGAISRELVKLMKPFGVPIMTYSPSVPDDLLEEFGVSRAPDLETLFSQNDVIVELAALTPKNFGIVTEELLRSIPEGGIFVNVGRGQVVDEEALARVAEDGKIQVALDVYGKEPLPQDSPFRKNDNVLTLPHLGGPTIDRRQDATLLGIENIKRYLANEPLEAEITAEIYARTT